MNLADLIPDSDFQFQMRFTTGTAADFFGPTAGGERLLAERRRWLRADPHRYAAVQPPGVPLLEEALVVAGSLSPPVAAAQRGLPESLETNPANPANPAGNSDHALTRCLALGASWEPDFLLLKPDDEGVVRLYSGCVCFPSSWSLAEKMGQPIDRIHHPVPGLNQQIGPQISTFLQRLKPGVAWLRSNWGLSRSPDLNQHPARHLPRLNGSEDLNEIWFRVEFQALVALPNSRGILFGIRLGVFPLEAFHADSEARRRLVQALRTMPEDVARYKGLERCARRLVELLR